MKYLKMVVTIKDTEWFKDTCLEGQKIKDEIYNINMKDMFENLHYVFTMIAYDENILKNLGYKIQKIGCNNQHIPNIQESDDERSGFCFKNADAFTATKTMHISWDSRQNSRSRIHCALVLSSRPHQTIYLAGILCQLISPTQPVQDAEPWLARQRHHRRRSATKHRRRVPQDVRQEDC